MSTTIRHWSREDRPIHRLQDVGVQNLSNSELLSILVGSGTSKDNAVEIGKSILESIHHNVNELGKRTMRELMEVPGVGIVTAARIMAAVELGRRRQLAAAMAKPRLQNALAIYNLMVPLMGDLKREEAWIVLMNQNFTLIKTHRISQGGITETIVDIRIVIKEALLADATIVALCHNHPSNNARPSQEDDKLTERVKTACETMRIHFLDHIIVCDGRFYSYREENKL